MLTGLTGWGVAVGFIVAVWLVLYIRKGPVEALGAAMVLSFAFPVWLKLEVAGVPLNVRSTIAAITMIGYAIHPRGKIISPLTLLDFCVGFMVCSQIVSDITVDGLSVGLPFAAYGEWALPYVAGRYAMRDRKDLRWIANWVAGVLLVLCVMSLIESLARVNLFETVFGERPVELAGRKASRLGFKRAFGTCMHPIYFGMAIAALTPWWIWHAQNTESKTSRTLGWCLLVVSFLGLLATVSRTPILTFLGMLGLLLLVRLRFLRVPAIVTAAVVLFLFARSPGEFADTIARYTGGGDRQKLIEVEGEAKVVSGVRGRILIWSAYWKAMRHAGVTGYGSAATSKFPPEIPYLEGRAETNNDMKLVDNGYIITVLRLGWLGAVFLVVMLLTGIFSAVSLFLDRPDQMFFAAVAAFLFLYMVFSLMLVSNNYDFFLIVLWLLGVLGGQCSRRIQNRSSIGVFA